jgi:hypothetical protein
MYAYLRLSDFWFDVTRAWYVWTLMGQVDPRDTREFFILPD